MRREKKKREERKKEKDFGFYSGFQNPNLYPFWIFGFQSCFCVILIVFSIFRKYDAKMNFRVTILN